MKEIILKAIKSVREAGELFLTMTLDQDSIIQKGTANYVTEVDYRVQEYLLRALAEILPGSNVITEESTENSYSFDKPTWILDPVDGTTNLMYGMNLSAVSLGLYVDGQPTLGIVYNPAINELFHAQAGHGAFFNGNRITVSGSRTLDQCLIGFGTSPYEKFRAEDVFSTVQRVYLSCRDVRRTGSAALDIAYVACGRLDAYFERHIQPWDYAGGLLILKEAGGRITDWSGAAPPVLAPSDILATNGWVHGQMMEILRI